MVSKIHTLIIPEYSVEIQKNHRQIIKDQLLIQSISTSDHQGLNFQQHDGKQRNKLKIASLSFTEKNQNTK